MDYQGLWLAADPLLGRVTGLEIPRDRTSVLREASNLLLRPSLEGWLDS